jgi:transketolase
VGVRDTFGESARDEEVDTLLEQYGLTATEIAKAVVEARSRMRK